MIIGYLIVSIFWGLFSVKQQYKYHSKQTEKWKLIFGFALNFTLWPLCFIFALWTDKLR